MAAAAVAAADGVRDRGRRRRGEDMRQRDGAQHRRPVERARKLHRHQRVLAHRAARRHHRGRLRSELPEAARDHPVPARVPRVRPHQSGQAVPEPGADPRRPFGRLPRTVADGPRQPAPRRGGPAQPDQHHPRFGHHHQQP